MFAKILAAVGLLLMLGCLAAGQQPAPSPAATPIDSDDGKDDIFFVVKLTAKELKMDVVPTPTVEFPGTHRRATAWLTERKNLPDKLEPGVTYRDIGITLRISSRFENIDEIVREALGEPTPTPPSKDAPQVAPAEKPSADVAAKKAPKTQMARTRRH